jgi:regulator of protease activity HflC (stomatin/prohibitin superfamily)
MEMDTVVFYQITDPKLYTYGHANPLKAIEHLVATSLRNIVGGLELDETLTSRELINSKIRVVLDEVTDAWGIKITRVEIQDIVPPHTIREAMEKQMTAERERRANVIMAEGERKAAILKAEGQKQAAILVAEGQKQAKILAAEATREKLICEAEGEAEAILQVEQAKAEGIKMINASEPTKEYLTIKSLDSLAEAANGESNTIIIPSEIQGLAGLAKSAAEVFKA